MQLVTHAIELDNCAMQLVARAIALDGLAIKLDDLAIVLDGYAIQLVDCAIELDGLAMELDGLLTTYFDNTIASGRLKKVDTSETLAIEWGENGLL